MTESYIFKDVNPLTKSLSFLHVCPRHNYLTNSTKAFLAYENVLTDVHFKQILWPLGIFIQNKISPHIIIITLHENVSAISVCKW